MAFGNGLTGAEYEELVNPSLRKQDRHYTEDMAQAVQGTRPSVRELRTDWTVVDLGRTRNPSPRSTKLHGKPGYRTVGATWRQHTVSNPIGGHR